jgi:hypothetical protein
MKHNEIGIAVAVGIVSASIIGAMLLWGTSFSNSIWTNGGSNLLGVIIGPSLAASIGVAAWGRWHGRCRATIPCIRRGEHPVAGTTEKVCRHHHTIHYHEVVHAAHHVEGMLGWGESHHLESSKQP